MPALESETVEKLRNIAKRFAAARKIGTVGSLLGAGGSAAVFQVSNGETVSALKIYNPTFFVTEGSLAEIHRLELHKKLIDDICESLVRVHEVEKFESTWIVLMENVSWPQLKSVLSQVPFECISTLIGKLVNAVERLTELGLVHRDIKPENILVAEDFQDLKLVDFGVIRELSVEEETVDGTDHGQKRPFIATAQYSSPEYLFRTAQPSEQSWHALNLYQLGAVLHDLITRVPLFQDEVDTGNRYRVALAVLRTRPYFTEEQRQNLTHFVSLSESCLEKDPDLRLKLAEYSDFKSDPGNSSNALLEFFKLRKHKSSHLNIGNHIKAIEEARKKLLSALLEEIRVQVLKIFGKDLQFSSPSQIQPSDSVTFSIHLGDELQDATFTILALWADRTECNGELRIGLADEPAAAPLGTIGSSEDILNTMIIDKIVEHVSQRLHKVLQSTHNS